MIQAKKLGWAAYVVSAALILFPLTDTFTSLYPWNIGEPRWRFGAVGLLSSALLIPMLGVLVALVTATVLEQRMARRVFGIVCIVAAVMCLGALGSFALDALQTRAAVRPEMQLSFKVAAVTAALKTLIACAVFTTLGLAALKGSGAGTAKETRDVPLFAAGSRTTRA